VTAEYPSLHAGPTEPLGRPLLDHASASITAADGTTVVTVSRRIEPKAPGAGAHSQQTVIAVDGEIDETTAPLMQLILRQGLETSTSVCCDLSRVTFFGAAGARVLLRASVQAGMTGCVFHLRGVHGMTARVLTVVDPGRSISR
jgi:anti-anti-sigma factor